MLALSAAIGGFRANTFSDCVCAHPRILPIISRRALNRGSYVVAWPMESEWRNRRAQQRGQSPLHTWR